MHYIDLSHECEDNMPGFRMKDKKGKVIEYTMHITPFLTHEQTSHYFDKRAEFEITQLEFQTSVGTYIDAPYHRFKEMQDISRLKIEDLIQEGIVIDAKDVQGVFTAENLPVDVSVKGKAVLINFGWDKYWGSEEYYDYPHIDEDPIHSVD